MTQDKPHAPTMEAIARIVDEMIHEFEPHPDHPGQCWGEFSNRITASLSPPAPQEGEEPCPCGQMTEAECGALPSMRHCGMMDNEAPPSSGARGDGASGDFSQNAVTPAPASAGAPSRSLSQEGLRECEKCGATADQGCRKWPAQITAERDRLRSTEATLRKALEGLLRGCESLDREESILPRQMQVAREALSFSPASGMVVVPEDELASWLDWAAEELSNQTCSQICDATYEARGCHGECAIEASKKRLAKLRAFITGAPNA